MGENLRVGVFDSGVGGLTVLAACVKLLPQATFLYYGDNSRAPYGSRPKEEIARFTREGVSLLGREGAEGVVIACNTATSVCLKELRAHFPFPIIGTEPAVLPAARVSRDVTVFCTPQTAGGERLRSLMARCAGTRFTVCPLPRLAGAIEEHFRSAKPLRLEEHLPRGRFGAVVLGCTHYSFFKKEISAFCSAPVFDGAEGIARRLNALFFGTSGNNAGLESHFCTELNTNISSQLLSKNDIIFLGNDRIFNENVYKHTFVFNKKS